MFERGLSIMAHTPLITTPTRKLYNLALCGLLWWYFRRISCYGGKGQEVRWGGVVWWYHTIMVWYHTIVHALSSWWLTVWYGMVPTTG